MVLEAQCFHGVGAFEVHLLKVSALKLSRASACSVFQNFSHFSLLRHSHWRGGKGEGIQISDFRFKGFVCNFGFIKSG